MLDTPFGFQMNADDLVARTQAYFAESVGTPVEVARWRRRDEPPAQQEQTLALLTRASWAFAGPGSPTYALRQWIGTGVPETLVDLARRGGTLVFGSAAACTLGTHAIPVYEIYKVGEDPRWAEGLDLLGRLSGLRAVVVPHYDNAEGGGHDTRFCYLGEQRLRTLEAHLPDDVGVLGVDEHTALLIDLEQASARVQGNGVVTVRRRGESQTFGDGAQVGLARLAALLRGDAAVTTASRPGPAQVLGPDVDATGAAGAAAAGTTRDGTPGAGTVVADSLRAETESARSRFEVSESERDVEGCVAAVLDLEAAIVAWSTDSRQSDDNDHARRVLRALVVRLGELAHDGMRDPREAVAPFVDALLDLRGRARDQRDFATSDLVRDHLSAAGIEVRDTPDGVTWSPRDASS